MTGTDAEFIVFWIPDSQIVPENRPTPVTVFRYIRRKKRTFGLHTVTESKNKKFKYGMSAEYP